jgi:hypothetical protein
MKQNAIKSIITIVVLMLIQRISALSSEKVNLRVSKTRVAASLNELARMRQVEGDWNPDLVTKYFKNQSPPNDKSIPFTDALFPPNLYSIEGKDSSGNFIDPSVSKKADNLVGRGSDGKLRNPPEWKRAKEIFQNTFYVFQDLIEPNDVIQREIGNCYFLSPLASVTEFPNLIYQLFRTTSVTANGYYELVLFIDGEWQVVILDDYFVVKPRSRTPKFAYPNGNEIWVMLVEKAWAKVNGGFANIVAGSEKDAFYSLTGYMTNRFDHSTTTREQIWAHLSTGEYNNEVMSASTMHGNSMEEKIKIGLVLGHAYTIIGTNTVTDRQGNQVKLVLLRNPWGEYEWKGDWSDNSPLWTPQLRKFVQYSSFKEDGIFYMSFEDYLKYFAISYICQIKYGAVVKNFKISDSEISAPSVFNFILEESSNLSFDVLLRHWRFNRVMGSDPNKITSMVLASYDSSNNLVFLESSCGPEEIINISKSLPKGSYVLWVYNSYYTLPDPKPNSYIIRAISQNERIKIQKIGLDSDLKLIRLMVNSALGNNSDARKFSSGVAFKSANELPKTCIGYTRISNESPKSVSVPVNFATDTILNFHILPPFNFIPPKKYSVNLPFKKTILILGVIKDYYECYNFGSGVSANILRNKEIQTEFLENLDISQLLLSESKFSVFERDFKTINLIDASIKKILRQ